MNHNYLIQIQHPWQIMSLVMLSTNIFTLRNAMKRCRPGGVLALLRLESFLQLCSVSSVRCQLHLASATLWSVLMSCDLYRSCCTNKQESVLLGQNVPIERSKDHVLLACDSLLANMLRFEGWEWILRDLAACSLPDTGRPGKDDGSSKPCMHDTL